MAVNHSRSRGAAFETTTSRRSIGRVLGPFVAVAALAYACAEGTDLRPRPENTGGTPPSGGKSASGGSGAAVSGSGGVGAGANGGTSGGKGGASGASGGGSSGNAGGGTPSQAGAPMDGGAAPGGAGGVSAEGGGAGAGGSGGDASGASGEGGATTLPGKLTAFYLSVRGRLLTVDLTDSDPEAETLIASAGDGPDGIAVDVQNRHLYWTNMGEPDENDGYLRRSNLDGSNVTTIVREGGTFTPKQLRLEPVGKKLYWSDREGMRIQRSNLDGTNVETLINVATGSDAREDPRNFCVGLALDLEGGWFYWTQKGGDNAGDGRIRRARLQMPAEQTATTRTDAESLFEGLPEPIDLELDTDAGYIYWTDRGDDTINRARIEIPAGETAASRDDREILVEGVSEVIGIALDLPRGHVYYTGLGGLVGRAELDGDDNRTIVSGSGALTGIAVVELR